METARTSPEADYDLLVAETAREHIRKVFKRLFAKLEALARSPLMRIRPRMSLLSGSLFVIAILFLPLAMDSCGHHATGPGLDIVTGGPDSCWPSYFLNGGVGRGAYMFLLVWAICALALVAYSATGSKVLARRRLLTVLTAISGAVTLLLLAGYCGDFVVSTGWRVMDWVEDGVVIEQWLPRMIPLLVVLVCIRCLRAKSVISSLPIRLLFFLGGGVNVLAVSVWIYRYFRGLEHGEFVGGDFVSGVIIEVPVLLYFLGPLLLWYRHGLWPARNSDVQWPPLRRRLAWIYVPAVAGQVWAAYRAIEIGVWGLIPCLLGIHLITVGYMELVREARAQQPVLSSAPPETAKGLGIEAQ
jgi:hypothetical protein